MAGDNPAKAVKNFADPLQETIHCIAPAYVNVRGGYHVRPDPHTLTLNDFDSVALKGPRDLTLWVTHDYEIVEAQKELGPWKVHSRGYIYLVSETDQPLFAYHWHPKPEFDVHFPHLHIYWFEALDQPQAAKMHFATGRVSLESVIRLLVREFEVQPTREDYAEALDNREAAFFKYRTWG
jgi:hypothetical protein